MQQAPRQLAQRPVEAFVAIGLAIDIDGLCYAIGVQVWRVVRFQPDLARCLGEVFVDCHRDGAGKCAPVIAEAGAGNGLAVAVELPCAG